MRFDVAVAKFEWGQSRKKDALATHSDFGKTQEKWKTSLLLFSKALREIILLIMTMLRACEKKCTELSKNIQYLIIIRKLYYKCFSGMRV